MGVRLVVFNAFYNEINNNGTNRHDELIHRDSVDQHPIYAISGLQEILNTIETNVLSITNTLIQQESDFKDYVDNEIQSESQILNNKIDNLSVIDSFTDTDSIDIDYTNKTFKADVKIYQDSNKTNALNITPDGLYVPKLVTKDTKSIIWDEISYGETVSDFFDDSIKFSHNDNSIYNNLVDSSEANSWKVANDSLNQPNNTVTYNGIVSKDYYDNYEHLVTISSTSSNQNVNGIVIGLIYDEYGNQHTLSVLLQCGSNLYLNYKFAIVYNFRLPGETLIDTYDLLNSDNAWSNYSDGITLYITKNNNNVTVSATNWGYNNQISNITDAKNISFEHTFTINLDNYSWGTYFNDKVRYGYSNLSQPNSYFKNILFYSSNNKSATNIFANLNISNDSNNAIQLLNDGVYVRDFIISPDSDNAIEHRNNGYYVYKSILKISNDRLNGLISTDTDTYYVHQSHSFITINQTSHNLSIGNFIYYDSISSSYQKALAKDNININIVGMVSYVYNENKFEYVCSGYVETDLFTETNGYVQGLPLYISDTTAGVVTQTQPDISKAVGYPVGNVGLIISIERGIQYNKEADIGDFKTSANTYNIRSDGFIKVAENIEYKLSLVQRLLDVLDDTFKTNYITVDNTNNTLKFHDVSTLYTNQNVENGMNLFIKAF